MVNLKTLRPDPDVLNIFILFLCNTAYPNEKHLIYIPSLFKCYRECFRNQPDRTIENQNIYETTLMVQRHIVSVLESEKKKPKDVFGSEPIQIERLHQIISSRPYNCEMLNLPSDLQDIY